MFINGAIVKSGKQEFVVIEVKSCTVKSNYEAVNARKSLSSNFRGLPIILMSQDSTGEKRFNGRPELINLFSDMDQKNISWKRYFLNKF